MKKQKLSWITDSIIAGMLLAICCVVNMSAEVKGLGAFLYSLGLFTIIHFGHGLYTGKAGYLVVKPPSYIGEVSLTLIGNGIGAFLGGMLLSMTRFGSGWTEKATSVINMKFADNPLSIFILAVFCGVLMYTAVEGDKKCTAADDHIGALFVVVAPVMVFILCGFNHCIADLAYFFLSRCAYYEWAVRYFILAILGNTCGCVLIPVFEKLSVKTRNEKA